MRKVAWSKLSIKQSGGTKALLANSKQAFIRLLLSFRHPLVRLFACFAIAAFIPTAAASQSRAEPSLHMASVKINLDELARIIVPVTVNGSGPFNFVLDTGCSKTIIDRKLADKLGLLQMGKKTVVGVLASADVSVVRVDSLSVAGVTVGGGEMLSADHSAIVNSNARGVLGEDFLRNFDLLIDYRHRTIRLGPSLGTMAQMATGEHLPMQLTGTYRGNPTHNRLVISARIPELGNVPLSLLLDSGANQLTLFRNNLGAGPSWDQPLWAGKFDQWVASTTVARRIQSVKIGNNSIVDLTVIARRADFDTDGLLPTSLFDSVLVSHLGKFVILNPSFPKSGGERDRSGD